MSDKAPPPLYADRTEWQDVVPIPQHDDGANPVAQIFYSDIYRDATDYFRGVVKLGETSERVLDITETVIRLNPAHYSAWQYRYKTLLAINSPLESELRLMDEIATKHLKTYQVWHHRRLLVTLLRSLSVASTELSFIAKNLRTDSKNYHTWSYRQWLLAHFNDDALWEGELDFIEELIEEDVRNNSAWSHRFFTVFEAGVRSGDEDREVVVRRELSFVKEKISLAPNNASAWNYLRGVLDRSDKKYSTLINFVTPYSLPASTDDSVKSASVTDLDDPKPSEGAELPCPAAIEFLADAYAEEGGEGVKRAQQLWKSLAEEHDTIRKGYWEYLSHEAVRSQS